MNSFCPYFYKIWSNLDAMKHQKWKKAKNKTLNKIISFSAIKFRRIYIYIHLLKVFLNKLRQHSLHDDHQRKFYFNVGFIIVNKQWSPLKGFQRVWFNSRTATVFIFVQITRFNNNIWILTTVDIYLHMNQAKDKL